VRGEAGIGKTRMVEEYIAMAQKGGFATHQSLVLDFGIGKGQDAVRSLVRSLVGLPPSSGTPAREAGAEKVLVDSLLEP
jgi:hypothetical protein